MSAKKTTKAAEAKSPRKAAERRPDVAVARAVDAPFAFDSDVQPTSEDFSLHDLFQQQTMAMLDRADLSEEQRQSILVAMNCPCCGGSGLSFTMKLKRKK